MLLWVAALLSPPPEVPERVDAIPVSLEETTRGLIREGVWLEVELTALFEDDEQLAALAGREDVERDLELAAGAVADGTRQQRSASAAEEPAAEEPSS